MKVVSVAFQESLSSWLAALFGVLFFEPKILKGDLAGVIRDLAGVVRVLAGVVRVLDGVDGVLTGAVAFVLRTDAGFFDKTGAAAVALVLGTGAGFPEKVFSSSSEDAKPK